MLGQCPAGQVEVGSRKCSCDRGYTQLGFSAICEPCASGHVKDVYGTEDCDTCVEHVLKKHNHFDPSRTVTRTTASRRVQDCGCSAGDYLSMADDFEKVQLSLTCPPLSHGRFQKAAYGKYFGECCTGDAMRNSSSGLPELVDACPTVDEQICLLRKCKNETLFGMRENVTRTASASRVSRSATKLPGDGVTCEAPMQVVERLLIQPGYWRPNELSTELRVCPEGENACVGSSPGRPDIMENLCGANRYGPLCSICYPLHFKTVNETCSKCVDVADMLTRTPIKQWLPAVLMMAVLLFGVILCLTGGGTLRTLLRLLLWLPEKLARPVVKRIEARRRAVVVNNSPAKGRRRSSFDMAMAGAAKSATRATAVGKWLYRLPGRLFRSVKAAVRRALRHVNPKRLAGFVKRLMPKLKILVGMYQVQDGMQVSFKIQLPASYLNILNALNFFDVNIPLDCFVTVNHHVRIIYRTMLPLVAEVFLLLGAFYAGQRHAAEEKAKATSLSSTPRSYNRMTKSLRRHAARCRRRHVRAAAADGRPRAAFSDPRPARHLRAAAAASRRPHT